ncbi:hypothetical protein SRABI26_00394 [Arthrobacter sp. Bi26]|nr:hypothetical protein SRABI26_00394 [Arthrobacter sp. Bi26]
MRPQVRKVGHVCHVQAQLPQAPRGDCGAQQPQRAVTEDRQVFHRRLGQPVDPRFPSPGRRIGPVERTDAPPDSDRGADPDLLWVCRIAGDCGDRSGDRRTQPRRVPGRGSVEPPKRIYLVVVGRTDGAQIDRALGAADRGLLVDCQVGPHGGAAHRAGRRLAVLLAVGAAPDDQHPRPNAGFARRCGVRGAGVAPQRVLTQHPCHVRPLPAAGQYLVGDRILTGAEWYRRQRVGAGGEGNPASTEVIGVPQPVRAQDDLPDIPG